MLPPPFVLLSKKGTFALRGDPVIGEAEEMLTLPEQK